MPCTKFCYRNSTFVIAVALLSTYADGVITYTELPRYDSLQIIVLYDICAWSYDRFLHYIRRYLSQGRQDVNPVSLLQWESPLSTAICIYTSV